MIGYKEKKDNKIKQRLDHTKKIDTVGTMYATSSQVTSANPSLISSSLAKTDES